MTDKPLHVQVAEVLGWRAFLSKHGHFVVTHGYGADNEGADCEAGFGHRSSYKYDPETGRKLPERTDWWEDCDHTPLFESDWSVTGPLIEEFGIALEVVPGRPLGTDEWMASLNSHRLRPTCPDYAGEAGYAATPLRAVCYLLLELGKAGKLKRP